MKNIEKWLFIAAAIATIIGVFIALFAWLFPREPKTYSIATNTVVVQQLQTMENQQNEITTQVITTDTPNVSTPIVKEVLGDVPGTPLEPGAKVISTLDWEIKPRDVYSIQLTAGETAHITIETEQAFELYMEKPGFSTFESSKGKYVGNGNYPMSIIAAVSGTYYLAVYPNAPGSYPDGVKYQISVTTDDAVIPDVLNDVPGTPIEPGIKITSTLDWEIKPRDVYSIQLTAGETAYISIETEQAFELYMEKPGFSTFESSKGNYVGNGNYPMSIIAAVSGTYYLAVYPNAPGSYPDGVKYQISITTDDAVIPDVLNDVPGTPLEPGVKITSTLDWEIKPRDVYSIQLNAGETAYISIETEQAFELYMEKPGFSTFESSNGKYVGNGNYPMSIIAAVSGTYYLAVYPNAPSAYPDGVKYAIKITVSQ